MTPVSSLIGQNGAAVASDAAASDRDDDMGRVSDRGKSSVTSLGRISDSGMSSVTSYGEGKRHREELSDCIVDDIYQFVYVLKSIFVPTNLITEAFSDYLNRKIKNKNETPTTFGLVRVENAIIIIS